MNILLCGANGFIAQNIRKALINEGHQVIGAGRTINPHCQLVVDYVNDTDSEVWLPRLAGIDVVINAVGVLRNTAQTPLAAIHRDTPIALFNAAVVAGVKRVIQISALGIEHSNTLYASTKRAADEHLSNLVKQSAAKNFSAVILRPSMVFGRGGDSSKMFVMLSKLPLLFLPAPLIRAKVQPLAVGDLARAVAQIVLMDAPQLLYECGGDTVLSLGDFIVALRQQQQMAVPHIITLPDWMTHLTAKIGDYLPASPLCSETLALLANDNVVQHAGFNNLLHSLTPLQKFWHSQWLCTS